MAETVTDLSGASVVLPTAVTVTVPVLVVEPAATVSVFALDSAKSAATAPVPAAAPTVTVTASLDALESVAVTVETPPLSEIDDGDNASLTVGAPSSSSIVSVRWPAGSATPLPPEAVPETLTSLFGSSTLLSTAAIVTVPQFDVFPAAIVSFVALDSA